MLHSAYRQGNSTETALDMNCQHVEQFVLLDLSADLIRLNTLSCSHVSVKALEQEEQRSRGLRLIYQIGFNVFHLY